MKKQIQKFGISYLVLSIIVTMSFGNIGYAEETEEVTKIEEIISEPVEEIEEVIEEETIETGIAEPVEEETTETGTGEIVEETISEPVEETISEPVEEETTETGTGEIVEETIAEPVEEIEEVVEDIAQKYKLDFMNFGDITLINGKIDADSTVFITNNNTGIFCEARSNSSGKFSCMFMEENLTKEKLTITDQLPVTKED